MGLIFIAMGILAIIGGVGIVVWVQRSEEKLTTGVGCMAATLIFIGVLIILWALYWT